MTQVRGRGTGGLIRYKNKDGSLKSAVWFGQYYDAEGRQHRKSTGCAVKAEAEKVLRTWMVDSQRGLKPLPETSNLHYENLRDALIESYRVRGHKSLQVTADGDETIFPLPPLDEFFAGKKARAITPDLIRQFIRKRQEDGVGNAAVNNSLSLLRRMFSIARTEGKLHNVPHIELLKPPPARRGFLRPQDFSRLLNRLPKHLHPLVTFLYYCGVRIGEALAVDWTSADLGKRLVTLQAGQTKNDEPRIIPLPAVLVEMLRATKRKEGPVFDATNLRKEWAIATAACKLDGLRIHDLRRSSIRNMMAAGAQQTEAMKISGHKTISVFQRYNIVDESQVKDVMSRVERLMPKARSHSKLFGESLVRVEGQKARKS